MSYFQDWQNLMSNGATTPADEERIKLYYQLETDAYERILTVGEDHVSGKASLLAEQLGFGREMVIFAGFLDGINSSLKTPLDLETIDDESDIVLEIDFRKLYWQMHEAKADWLYSLKAWNEILSPDEQKELTREYRTSKIVRHEKVGRNDPCPCGSGKKFKNCCGKGA